MDVAGLLAELFGRVDDEIEGAIDGLSAEQLATPPEPGANTIGWLVWHLTRVEDSHIAELIDGADELWSSGPWAASFGLEPDPAQQRLRPHRRRRPHRAPGERRRTARLLPRRAGAHIGVPRHA